LRAADVGISGKVRIGGVQARGCTPHHLLSGDDWQISRSDEVVACLRTLHDPLIVAHSLQLVLSVLLAVHDIALRRLDAPDPDTIVIQLLMLFVRSVGTLHLFHFDLFQGLVVFRGLIFTKY
jgi:hypothetical protein